MLVLIVPCGKLAQHSAPLPGRRAVPGVPYRRARTAERAQLKWLVYAAVLVLAALLLLAGLTCRGPVSFLRR